MHARMVLSNDLIFMYALKWSCADLNVYTCTKFHYSSSYTLWKKDPNANDSGSNADEDEHANKDANMNATTSDYDTGTSQRRADKNRKEKKLHTSYFYKYTSPEQLYYTFIQF